MLFNLSVAEQEVEEGEGGGRGAINALEFELQNKA